MSIPKTILHKQIIEKEMLKMSVSNNKILSTIAISGFSTVILMQAIILSQSTNLLNQTNLKLDELQIENKMLQETIDTQAIEISNALVQLNSVHTTEVIITNSEDKNDKEKVNNNSNITTYESCEVPDFDTSFKGYMDYRCITDKTSAQYEFQEQAWTDANGLRRVNDDYMVAMGTYYTEECGSRFKIGFESGIEVTVFVADIKQDCHTDEKHQYTPVYDTNGDLFSANVLEFIVDTEKLPNDVALYGSIDRIEYLQGNIRYIERIIEK